MAKEGTCKAEGCDKGVRAKGYCETHYSKWKKGKMPKPRRKSCNAEGCHKPQDRRGLCTDHFNKEFSKSTGEGAPAAGAAS